jgi:hypothetical protein
VVFEIVDLHDSRGTDRSMVPVRPAMERNTMPVSDTSHAPGMTGISTVSAEPPPAEPV